MDIINQILAVLMHNAALQGVLLGFLVAKLKDYLIQVGKMPLQANVTAMIHIALVCASFLVTLGTAFLQGNVASVDFNAFITALQVYLGALGAIATPQVIGKK